MRQKGNPRTEQECSPKETWCFFPMRPFCTFVPSSELQWVISFRKICLTPSANINASTHVGYFKFSEIVSSCHFCQGLKDRLPAEYARKSRAVTVPRSGKLVAQSGKRWLSGLILLCKGAQVLLRYSNFFARPRSHFHAGLVGLSFKARLAGHSLLLTFMLT